MPEAVNGDYMHATVAGICACAGVDHDASEELASQLAAQLHRTAHLVGRGARRCLDLDGCDPSIFAFQDRVYLIAVVGSPVFALHWSVQPVQLPADLPHDECLQKAPELGERLRGGDRELALGDAK